MNTEKPSARHFGGGIGVEPQQRCPVYRRSGGLSYGATYSGPIGLIIDPTFYQRKYSNLPFASSLNGCCSNVCPVKITPPCRRRSRIPTEWLSSTLAELAEVAPCGRPEEAPFFPGLLPPGLVR
jgi:hypothetical protein